MDGRPRPDQVMLDRVERRNRLGPQLYRQRVKVLAALEVLPAEDAYLLRRMFLEGADVQALEAVWGVQLERRLGAAVRKLSVRCGNQR